MNIPFSPFWLWPVPVLLVVAAWVWQRRLHARWMRLRERVKQAGIEELTEPERRLTRKRCPLSLSWILLVAASIVAMDIRYFSVPPIEGRVIDAVSGEPLAGVTVQRTMTRVGRYYLAEVPSSTRIGPVAECVTGADGEFAFPRWTALWPSGWKGMSGVQWVAYGPGLMPEEGCIEPVRDPFMASVVGCVDIGFGPGVRWTAHESRYVDGKQHLEVRLSRPDDQAAWEEAFRRAAGLVVDEGVPLELYMDIAVARSHQYVLSDEIIRQIDWVQRRLAHMQNGEYYKVAEAGRLFAIVGEYCSKNAERGYCAGISSRYFLGRATYLRAAGATP